jgi:preprotein translocase subunit SecE
VAKKDKTEAEIKDKEKDKEAAAGFNPTKFFQETKEELAKVVWPSRQQLISESAAVLLMVVLSATLIYLVDGLFVWVSGQVFQ